MQILGPEEAVRERGAGTGTKCTGKKEKPEPNASPELRAFNAPLTAHTQLRGRGPGQTVSSLRGDKQDRLKGKRNQGALRVGPLPQASEFSQTKYDTRLKCHYPTIVLSKLHLEFVTGAGGYKINLPLYFSKSNSIIFLPVGCRLALN